MTAVDMVRDLHTHRAWVTARLLAAARPLSPGQLRQPLAIGQGSVWRSLMHLHAAEYVWLEALLGNETAMLPGDLAGHLPGNQLGAGGPADVAEMERAWQALDARWDDYLAGLTDAALGDTVYRVSTSSMAGKRLGVPRSAILLHVCTHAQYTVAQTVNMLRQVGADSLPDVMLITKAREEAPPA